MTPLKFRAGQRVVAKPGVTYAGVDVGGWKGTVAQEWPKAGLLESNQYNVHMEPFNKLGAGHIVFGEDQLGPDVLEELASL